ncbi:hypothetical protein PHMEG_00018276 [Phytophthora megakarya]|uniref:Uncharacterized protein n=1 Tax=Phytophthora megakarya TaxID=4795 RepID=A0A225VVR4_9STRA|nr:hypothetical protein PHMEG_00018276 [Phytophthora megakarya]
MKNDQDGSRPRDPRKCVRKPYNACNLPSIGIRNLFCSIGFFTGRKTLAAAGLLFEQVKNRLPFQTNSNKRRTHILERLSWQTLPRELKSRIPTYLI